MSNQENDFSALLKPVGRWTLDVLVNQFLYEYVDDEQFDEAKEHLGQLLKIKGENTEEEIKLHSDDNKKLRKEIAKLREE